MENPPNQERIDILILSHILPGINDLLSLFQPALLATRIFAPLHMAIV